MDELLNKLIQGDRDAFQQFYDRYSLPVYRYIQERTGDPERTRTLWKNTFRALRTRLRTDGADLPMLLLTALADTQLAAPAAQDPPPSSVPSVDGETILANCPLDADNSAPVSAKETQKPTRRRRGAIAVLLILLILLAAFAVWVNTGILMTQGVLPAYDLGYSWFNSHIFPLFPPR